VIGSYIQKNIHSDYRIAVCGGERPQTWRVTRMDKIRFTRPRAKSVVRGTYSPNDSTVISHSVRRNILGMAERRVQRYVTRLFWNRTLHPIQRLDADYPDRLSVATRQHNFLVKVSLELNHLLFGLRRGVPKHMRRTTPGMLSSANRRRKTRDTRSTVHGKGRLETRNKSHNCEEQSRWICQLCGDLLGWG
jgi:hypothetical protein